MTRDPYEVLGLPDDASEEAIKTVYRQLARTFHPDVNPAPSAAARFREITDAYAVLSDPELRAESERRTFRVPRHRSRGQRIGLKVAGIDLGGLLAVTVHVEGRPLRDDDVDLRSERPSRAGRRLPRRRR